MIRLMIRRVMAAQRSVGRVRLDRTAGAEFMERYQDQVYVVATGLRGGPRRRSAFHIARMKTRVWSGT